MSKLGILSAERCALLVCDLQERFADSIRHFPTVVSNAERMLKTARILDLRVLATEQYPKVITYWISISLSLNKIVFCFFRAWAPRFPSCGPC